MAEKAGKPTVENAAAPDVEAPGLATRANEILSDDGNKFMVFYAKLFGVLFVNTLFSMLVAYLMVTTNTFKKGETWHAWLAVASVILGIASYAILYATVQRTQKILVALQVIALYIYIASISVWIVLLSPFFVFFTSGVMYSLVATCFSLLALLIFTVVSRTCLKQGGKTWALSASTIGVLVALAYLALVIYVNHDPALLPDALYEVIRDRNSAWRRLVLFIFSAVLSGGFVYFVIFYSMWYISKHETALEDGFLWARLLLHIYVYISLPLVALGKAIAWIFEKIMEYAKKAGDGTHDKEVKENPEPTTTAE